MSQIAKKPTEEPVKKESTIKSHPSSVTKMLTIGLASAAFLGSVGAIYLNIQSYAQNKIQIDSMHANIDLIKKQQTIVSESVTQALESTGQTQRALTEKVSDLNQTFQNAMKQRWYQSNDWLLLKVRYYLELAQINAHWSDQTQTSIALLQEADELLSDFRDERLLMVRQSIAQEISALKSAPQIDMVKILSQLDALQNAILSLPTKLTPLVKKETRALTSQDSADIGTWRERLTQSLTILERLVVIQHHQQEVTPILTEDYVALLRENMRLCLQEAQWAVLRLNNDLYHLLLVEVLSNVNRSFDINAQSTKGLLSQLDDLQRIDLKQSKVTIDESLTLLNQFIQAKEVNDAPEPNLQEPTS